MADSILKVFSWFLAHVRIPDFMAPNAEGLAIFRRKTKVAMAVLIFELLQLLNALIKWNVCRIDSWWKNPFEANLLETTNSIFSKFQRPFPLVWITTCERSLHIPIDLNYVEDLFLPICNKHFNAYFITRPFRCFSCYKLRSMYSAIDFICPSPCLILHFDTDACISLHHIN